MKHANVWLGTRYYKQVFMKKILCLKASERLVRTVNQQSYDHIELLDTKCLCQRKKVC